MCAQSLQIVIRSCNPGGVALAQIVAHENCRWREQKLLAVAVF